MVGAQTEEAAGQGKSGGLTVSLQVPTSEFAVPAHLHTLTSTGEVETVAPWFPASLVIQNGTGRDIELNWLGEPRVIYTLSSVTGEKVWSNAPFHPLPEGGSIDPVPGPTLVPGSLAQGAQFRETAKVPLTGADKPLPAGSYVLSAVLNSDHPFSAQTVVSVVLMEVPRADTGVAGRVVRVNTDGSATGVKASLQLVEVLAPGVTRSPNNRSGESDTTGKFSLIGVFPGVYRLSVTTSTSQPGQGASDTLPVMVVEGQMLEVGALRLTKVPLSSTGAVGRVVKEVSGDNLPGEIGTKAVLSFVEVVPAGVVRGANSRSGETDSHGNFKISGFFPGTYRVNAFPPAGTVGLAASEAGTVVIEVDRYAEVGALKLRSISLPATGVDGTAVTVDASGKETWVPGATVQLQETEAPAEREAHRFTSITGPDGRFVLGVSPGTYAITITKVMPATATSPAMLHTGTGSVVVLPNARTSTRIMLAPKRSA